MESVSSGGESPLSDSGDTVILQDNETPEKFEQRPSSGVSFLRFASIDGQTYEPRPPLTKQAIYEALAAQSSTVGCTTASDRLPGLSFLQSHPSFSALLQNDQKTPSPMEDSVSSNGRAPYPAVLRKKNREAARKCRQKKKNYLMQLENDFKELKVGHLNAVFN
ncbi:unnamed protein product [Dibothriocephalus latus]|uniref:BZIP domain-containing protein n=1 Tax=Dibothriocephalus latus TaxID=60516 RepID=A0A3P7MER2_DIBLA|nr:unnamed protein product [Dibothriocephalus latus]